MLNLRNIITALAFPLLQLSAEPLELSKHQSEPAFLIPVSPRDRDLQASIEGLLGRRLGNGTMICSGLESDDFAVSAWEKNGSNFITYIQVARSGNTVRAKNQIDVAIDPEFAAAIQRAWAIMLLQAHYPQNEYRGADGYEVEFSVNVGGLGAIYGQAWSPTTGLVKELVDLGQTLADFCRAKTTDRPEMRQRLLTKLHDFQGRAAKIQANIGVPPP